MHQGHWRTTIWWAFHILVKFRLSLILEQGWSERMRASNISILTSRYFLTITYRCRGEKLAYYATLSDWLPKQKHNGTMTSFRSHFVFVWRHGGEIYSANCSLANQRAHARAKSTVEVYVLILGDTSYVEWPVILVPLTLSLSKSPNTGGSFRMVTYTLWSCFQPYQFFCFVIVVKSDST